MIKPKKYTAKLLFESLAGGKKHLGNEITIVLIIADDADKAYDEALLVGKDVETSYHNVYGENITWNFIGIMDLQEIDNKFSHGTELFYELCNITTKKQKSLIPPKEKLSIFVL